MNTYANPERQHGAISCGAVRGHAQPRAALNGHANDFTQRTNTVPNFPWRA
jgi:hypothetical protein